MSKHRGHNEGSIYERKDKEGKVYGFQAQMSLPNGKRKTFSAKTKREVQRKLEEGKSALSQGRLISAKSQTMETYLTEWLKTVEYNLRPRTHEVYSLNVRRMTPYIGGLKLDRLGPSDVQNLLTQLRDKGLSPRTVQQVHTVLHTSLEAAVRLDLVVRNVAHVVRPPRVVRKEMKTLSPDQLRFLYECTAADRFGPLWVLLSTTGLRITEGTGLKWQDVDFEAGTLSVRRALQRQKGKGLVFVEPKTKRSRRNVQLSRLACDALKEQRDRQVFLRKTAQGEWHENDLVFSTALGTGLDRGRVYLNWVRALKDHGLPRVRPHDLRHTAATLMLQMDVHPKIVQEMLGHSSIGITLDIYSHSLPTMHRAAVDGLDALLAKPAKLSAHSRGGPKDLLERP